MKASEAVHILKMIQDECGKQHMDSEAEALQMAIGAFSLTLESDCISRQATKNAVRDELKRNPTMAIRTMNAIDNLPSAQPEQQSIPYSVCDLCVYNPPSSMDGKPCSICVAQDKPKDDDSWSYG